MANLLNDGGKEDLKGELKLASYFGMVFIIYSIIITILGFTIVPVDAFYTRAYTPWADENTSLSASRHWNIGDYREGDALFEYAYHIIDTLKQLERNSTNKDVVYSFETALGYPLGPGFGYSSGVAFPLARLFLKALPGQYEKCAYYAINISAGFWAFLAFVVLWLLGYFLFGRSYYNPIIGLAANPIFFLSVQESWMMSITGCLIILLAIVMMIKQQKLSPVICILAFLGSMVAYNSGIYQFFVYIPLLYIMSSLYLIKVLSLRRYLILGLCIGVGILVDIDKLYWTYMFIKQSTKNVGSMIPDIAARGYATFIFQSMIELPNIKNLIGKMMPVQNFLFGMPVFIFGCIGWFKLSSKNLKIFVLLILLYWMGPLQYLLSLIPGPFRTETSIRMGYFVYICFVYLAVYSLKYELFKKHRELILKIVAVCTTILTYKVVKYIISGVTEHSLIIWTTGIIQLITGVFLLFFLKYKMYSKRSIVIIFMILIPFSNGFLFIGSQTLVPYPVKIGVVKEKIPFSNNKTNHYVGALVVDGNGQGTTFHPDFWYTHGTDIPSVNAYRNPYIKEYAELFWYQYSKNVFIGQNGISSQEDLNKLIRENWLLPIPIYNGIITKETERFFDLTGVNLVASKSDVIIHNPGWKVISQYKNINIWLRERKYNPIRIIGPDNIVYDKSNDFSVVKKLLSDDSFNLEHDVILSKGIRINPLDKSTKILDVRIQNGAIELNVEGVGGLIQTNYTYNQGIKAYDVTTNRKLEVVRVNHAFLGIKMLNDKESHMIKIVYEQPRLLGGLF
jgi:hypothetical protein